MIPTLAQQIASAAAMSASISAENKSRIACGGPMKARIVDELATGEMTATEIAARIGVRRQNVDSSCAALVRDGRIERIQADVKLNNQGVRKVWRYRLAIATEAA